MPGSLTGKLLCDQYLKLFYQNLQLTLLCCFQDELEQQKSGHRLLNLIWWYFTSEEARYPTARKFCEV